MPRPVDALPCGSRSMMSTCSPIAASAVPRLIAVVVFPTPPFWLAMARTRGGLPSCGTVVGADGWADSGNGTMVALGAELGVSVLAVGSEEIGSDMARILGKYALRQIIFSYQA